MRIAAIFIKVNQMSIMDSNDRRLGMDRPITRRDFLNGVGIANGAAMLTTCISKGVLSAAYIYRREKGTSMAL